MCSSRHYTVLFLVTVGLLALSGCASKSGSASQVQYEVPADQRIIEHTVGPGESLARIADNYYGDPDRYQTIAEMKAALIPQTTQASRPADPLGAFIRLLFGRSTP